MEVIIAGRKLDAPVYEDKETTSRIVKRVNKRLKEIEKGSKRIDTQAFALLSAVSFAAELELSEAGRKDDVKEVLVALDRLSTALKELVEDYADE